MIRGVKHDTAGKAAQMLEVAPDAMFLVDGAGKIIVVNFGGHAVVRLHP